jgi:hypothetical protein
MKTNHKFILLLVFLSPAIGELLSGSAPPLEFFNPIGFLIIVTFYGGSTLLIREAKAYWNLQWSIIFLAIAYGIIEEGIMMQSFFNFNHADLGNLAHYGEIYGIHIPWTISLIVYHATISTLIPITIVETIFPQYKQTPLVKKKGLLFTGSVVALTTIIMMIVVWYQQTDFAVPYVPNPVLLLGSLFICVLLIWLAYHFKNSSIKNENGRLFPPWIFFFFGLFLIFGNVFIIYIFADNHVSSTITIVVQIINLIIILLFARFQILHQRMTNRHISAFILGSLISFCVFFAPINEFANGSEGMTVVGIIALILFLYWRRYIIYKVAA